MSREPTKCNYPNITLINHYNIISCNNYSDINISIMRILRLRGVQMDDQESRANN